MSLIADVVKKFMSPEYGVLQTIDVAILQKNETWKASWAKDDDFSPKHYIAYLRYE